MRKTTETTASQDEVTILARVLCNEKGELPADIARYLLNLGFSERDKARAHDLAVRNQQAAAIVWSMCFAMCAAEMKAALNWLHGR